MMMRSGLSLVLLFAIALPASAHHVSGKVYCDNDGNGVVSGGDVPLNGIQVRATSTGPAQVGAEFSTVTPYNLTAGRFYLDLIQTTNNYTLAITGGTPPGATFLSPAGGAQAMTFVSGDPASEAQITNFLLGNCGGASLCDPTQCDDGNPCTDDSCDPQGACEHPPNSKLCDDHNSCTKDEVCSNGSCKGSAVTCDDQNPCTDDSCKEDFGCEYAFNTAPCSDSDTCTQNDVCSGGKCAPGAPLNCNDNNPCTDDSCKADFGCEYANNTVPCSDGDTCTQNDACSGGKCAPGTPLACNDNNPCTTDTCGPNGCVFTPNSAVCNDNNACTKDDVCTNGTCKGGVVDCNDGNACTDDSCKLDVGCEYANNTAPCSDGNTCTQNDVCSAGKCTAGTPLDCNDNNPCTDDACSAGGCTHTANAVLCTDGDACTVNDQCKDTKCEGAPKACPGADQCHGAGTCDQSTGVCSNPVKPNGTACDDNNTCSSSDQCTNGTCTGQARNCDDNNPCTDDACGATGCTYTNNTAACTDNNLCTTDVCSAGTCHSTPKTCDDNNMCNGQESCDPATGACTSTGSATPFFFCSLARINNRGTITGDITVNDPQGLLHLSRGVMMSKDSKITANEVELAASSVVYNVCSNITHQDDTATILGTKGPATLPVVSGACCPIPAATCGTQAVTVGVGATGAPLAPGAYGALSLAKNASLTLLPGTFTFCSIDLSLGAKLSTSGATTINDTGNLSVPDLATLGAISGQPLPAINVGGTDIRLGEAGLIRGLLTAPNAEARFGRQAMIEGTMCINILGTDKGTSLSCLPQANLAKGKRHRRRLRAAARAAAAN